MDNYRIICKTTGEWIPYSDVNRNLFSSSHWLEILTEGLNARVYLIVKDVGDVAIPLTVFKKGPFKIGYIYFPVGKGECGLSFDSVDYISILNKIKRLAHQFRLPVDSIFDDLSFEFSIKKTYVTIIENLAEWRSNNLGDSLLRNIKKAKRLGVTITKANIYDHGVEMYRLYKETVIRHDGQLKYSQLYFNLLVNLSVKSSLLRCSLATLEGRIIAFMVVGINNSEACYLHGSVDYNFQSFRPTDFLFIDAIEWAIEKECNKFNFMDSPLNQPLLVRYKEKWGGRTYVQQHAYVNTSVIMGNLFCIALHLHDFMRKTMAVVRKLF